MAVYANLATFMQRVRAVNTKFEKFKTSSLRPLINVLQDLHGSAAGVDAALGGLVPDKANKYKNALYYLMATYPGVSPTAVNFGPVGKRNAVRFQRTAMPPAFNPTIPTQDRLISGSITALNKSVEEFLLTAPAQTGVLLIHLSGHVPELDVVVQGEKTVDHMVSVLQLAADKAFNLCILYQNAPPVCPELQTVVGAFTAPVLVHVHPQQMGGRDANFRNFMSTHSPVVVMGFDACVCVRANLFGSTETMPTPPGGYVPPVLSLTDVVTSRAVLATGGTISPIAHKGEFGVLANQ